MFASTDRTTGVAYPVSQAGTGQPKEIGVMQRLDGIRNGVSEIEYQLTIFLSVLRGEPGQAAATGVAPPCPAGLVGTLGDTEARIRETLGLLKQLTDAF